LAPASKATTEAPGLSESVNTPAVTDPYSKSLPRMASGSTFDAESGIWGGASKAPPASYA
jgi:hypothetical protein